MSAETVVVLPMTAPMESVNKLVKALHVKKHRVLSCNKMIEATQDTAFCVIPNEIKTTSWFLFFDKENSRSVLEAFGKWKPEAKALTENIDFYIFQRAHHIKIL